MSILPFAPLVHCGFTLAYGLTYKRHPIDARNQEALFYSTIRPERSIFFQHNVYCPHHLPSGCYYGYFSSLPGFDFVIMSCYRWITVSNMNMDTLYPACITYFWTWFLYLQNSAFFSLLHCMALQTRECYCPIQHTWITFSLISRVAILYYSHEFWQP